MFIIKCLYLLIMSPFAFLYGFVVAIRNFCYDRKIFKSKGFNIPIISIGNISVGGTGKTPHTEFFYKMLQAEFNVAVLSRGYKRKTKGYRLLNTLDSYLDVGDEPLQIKCKFPEAIVAVCEDRVKGVERLMLDFKNIDVIILDDAFQHRKIRPSISIVLNDYNFPITKDHLLPMGRLRESSSSIYRADIVITTKCPLALSPIEARIITNDLNLMPFQDLFFSTQRYLDLLSVFNDSNQIKLNDLINYKLLLVTGIAKAEGLLNFLESKSKSVKHIAFSDHHSFKKKEIDNVEKIFNNIDGNKLIVLTEKDSVRLRTEPLFSDDVKDYVYYIPIEVFILGGQNENKKLKTKILRNVRANKRNDSLHNAKS